MRALLAFYSWSGNTRMLAQRISTSMKCDVEEIYERKRRKGRIGFIMGGFEAALGLKPPIDEPKKDPSGYDILIIGSPIWAGDISSPVRTYLSRAKGIKRVAFFCTQGGTDPGKAIKSLAKLCGKEPDAVLAVREKDIPGAEIQGFLESIKG